MIGKPLFEIIHPDYHDRCRVCLQQVFAGETIKRYETAFITRDGSRLDIEVSAAPEIVDGSVISARAICREITERIRAARELQ